jgi:hypothetical protein
MEIVARRSQDPRTRFRFADLPLGSGIARAIRPIIAATFPGASRDERDSEERIRLALSATLAFASLLPR